MRNGRNWREEKSIELWRLAHLRNLRRFSLFLMYLVLHNIPYQVLYVFEIRHSTQLIMLSGVPVPYRWAWLLATSSFPSQYQQLYGSMCGGDETQQDSVERHEHGYSPWIAWWHWNHTNVNLQFHQTRGDVQILGPSDSHSKCNSSNFWIPTPLAGPSPITMSWVEYNVGSVIDWVDGGMQLKFNSKNLSTTVFFFNFLVRKGEEGELFLPVGSRVWGRMPKKKTVQSSITSMGFPLLEKPGEICEGRPVGLSGKFWNFNRGWWAMCSPVGVSGKFCNFNRGCVSEEEATTLFKCPKWLIWWGWWSQWWDSEVVKSFRRRMSALCQCRGWYTERVWDDVAAPIPLAKNSTNTKDFFNSPDNPDSPRALGPGLGHRWVN
jgi:hypothetical protein